MAKELAEMTFRDLHDEQCGVILVAIGKGDYRSAVWGAMEAAMRKGFEAGKKQGIEDGYQKGWDARNDADLGSLRE